MFLKYIITSKWTSIVSAVMPSQWWVITT